MNRSRPKRLPTGQFLPYLQEVLDKKGLKRIDLVDILDIHESSIYAWWFTDSWVSLEDVATLADHFEDQTLIQRAIAERTKVCDWCQRQFVARRQFQRFCARSCSTRVSRDKVRDRRHQQYTVRATALEETIDLMCRSCEPSGLCRQADCPIQLRGHSPFPLAHARSGTGRGPEFVYRDGPIPVKAAQA